MLPVLEHTKFVTLQQNALRALYKTLETVLIAASASIVAGRIVQTGAILQSCRHIWSMSFELQMYEIQCLYEESAIKNIHINTFRMFSTGLLKIRAKHSMLSLARAI